MDLITLEQLEVLMLVAGAEAPFQTAVQVRQRWKYILEVAGKAKAGEVTDQSLPQVIHDCDRWIARAGGIVSVLDEWLREQQQHRPASDVA
jgi:hypothetical protein